MKSDYKFPYALAVVPYFMILALASFWFMIVIPSHAADIPIRFNFSNQPQWYVQRLGFIVLFLFIEIVVAGSILLSAYYWDNRLDEIQKKLGFKDDDIINQVEGYRKSKNTISLFNLFFYFLLILILFNYSLFYYQMKHIISPVPVVLIALSMIILDLIFTLYQLRTKEKTISQSLLKDINREQPDLTADHWLGGIIYYNKEDFRFFVPKRSGLGITINHARIGLAVLIYAIIIVAISAIIYW